MSKKYTYKEYIEDRDFFSIIMVEEIKEKYYPLWRQKMITKYGEEYVDRNYSLTDCLKDWISVNSISEGE